MTVEAVATDIASTAGAEEGSGQGMQEPAFRLSYTDSTPRQAQEICSELTSRCWSKNLTYMQDGATGTTNVLSKGIEDAKRNLDELDSKLAAFKKQYVGQLPGDEEDNLKILMGLNSQLEANTQTLNRAQQDRTYTESVLAQQLAAWKSSQSSTNPDRHWKNSCLTCSRELLSLQARYTDDHPDVIKTKADIAEVKKKLAEINKASTGAVDSGNDKASAMEPAEIRQLRIAGPPILGSDRGGHARPETVSAGNCDVPGASVAEPGCRRTVQGADARLRKRAEELSGSAGQEEQGGFDRQYDQPVRRRADD